MMHPVEHIHKGLGWYSYNGRFFQLNPNRLVFVGRTEHFQKDFNEFREKTNLSGVLGTHGIGKLRSGDDVRDKTLSRNAVNNIIDFYQDTDYAALSVLKKHSLIDSETFDSYFHYHHTV